MITEPGPLMTLVTFAAEAGSALKVTLVLAVCRPIPPLRLHPVIKVSVLAPPVKVMALACAPEPPLAKPPLIAP